MATPYVVQTVPSLGRACTHDYCDHKGRGVYNDRPSAIHCCQPTASSRWAVESRTRERTSLSPSRRRSNSEGMEVRRPSEDRSHLGHSFKEYNLRSGSNYYERTRNSRKYYHCESASTDKCNKQTVAAAYPLVDTNPTPSHLSTFRTSSNICRQFLASCENNVDVRNRCVYFSKKCRNEAEQSPWGRRGSSAMQEDRYNQEVEKLRSRLRELKDSPQDAKRVRQNSDSDCGLASGLDPGTKRPRDNSHQIRPLIATLDEPVNPAMLVPRIPRKNIPSSEEVTSVSSDSEFADSACDEEDLKGEPELEGEESAIALPSPKISSVEVHCSLSHMVGDTLGSISLNDQIATEQQQQAPVLSNNQIGDNAVAVSHKSSTHPSLRVSLFSHVPPFIRFSTHEVKGSPLPTQIQSLLKWKLSRITPVIVRRTVYNSGFKIVRKSNEWCGTWGKHMKSLCFKTIRDFQKMNHFPGSFQIGRKDHLWRNLLRLMTKFGKKEFGFMPRTYILPQDNKLLRSAWEKHCGKDRWIVKPPASARGAGIKVIHKWSQIPKKCPLIVQKYISDPYLINGNKFDLRLYALVASINPLRIYLYDNGLVRFASVKYSNDLSTLVDRYMHLTNYSINKQSSQYTQNEDAAACQGHKWTLKALWSFLEKHKRVNVQQLWARMVDLVVKTVISGESSMTQLSHAHLTSRYCAYELFGVDILLDEDLKPWLLEVNISPSLHSSTPLDTAVKGPLVRDLLNLAGYQIPSKMTATQQESLVPNLGINGSLCYDQRLYTTVLSPAERSKHNEYQQIESREEYLDSILKDLTPDDVRHLIQYEDELTQIGNFERIFPTNQTHEYFQFFDNPRYYNMLFDAWETRYHKNRSKGVQLLENLCLKNVHLEVDYAQQKRTKASTSHTQVHQAAAAAATAEAASGWSEAESEAADEQGGAEAADERGVPGGKRRLPATQPDKPREKWGIIPTAICRAARTRSGKPGVVTKPFPRSSYITRRSAAQIKAKNVRSKT